MARRCPPAPSSPPTARCKQACAVGWSSKPTTPLGYVEQLYTFADRGRTGATPEDRRTISISYLGLTRESEGAQETEGSWHSWYRYFPWEDHRTGRPLEDVIEAGLRNWCTTAHGAAAQAARWQRARYTFGLDSQAWNEELILQRYELLYEAAMVPEADGFTGAPRAWHPHAPRSPPHPGHRHRPGCAPKSNTARWCSN